MIPWEYIYGRLCSNICLDGVVSDLMLDISAASLSGQASTIERKRISDCKFGFVAGNHPLEFLIMFF